MGFKSFNIGIILRVTLIIIVALIGNWIYLKYDSLVHGFFFLLLVSILTWNLISYCNKTNRKISRFLESIRYSDFSSTFTKDDSLGKSFRELNLSFNEVISAFKKTRAEKEEQMLFLRIMIQQINTGIISFDTNGKIGIINGAAKQLLQIPQFKDINDLGKLSNELLQVIKKLNPGNTFSFKVNTDLHLNFQSTVFIVDGEKWTLISFQNINTELQKKELEAWQNLTSVLRHEIMNSITPIASLASSLGTILSEDTTPLEDEQYAINQESFTDLKEGLFTISNRSKGLVDFVNAYRDFTNIPLPKLKKINIEDLLRNTSALFKSELSKDGIVLKTKLNDKPFEINLDQELIQMILINLIKNAKEALANSSKKEILLNAGIDTNHHAYIQVIDNGEGIVPEALERIFVPFFTTKKTGSGIGLAISRQIMNLHNGSLEVSSIPHEKTSFTLRFI
ncbi:ATP-binding protein [Belliella sp. R4-6]|uniref:histidine kinase n=1 Tax=Belliella alkalica TaxID=1730871 RepID=A0ABS9VFK1_9BACT|nr:ATP-binding protein [Belliella alkalica]MCH7415214.1 ATP-binding protein [Belliella alkalica]